jgi:hypothetical protein
MGSGPDTATSILLIIRLALVLRFRRPDARLHP